jgi:hypothetical protein
VKHVLYLRGRRSLSNDVNHAGSRSGLAERAASI